MIKKYKTSNLIRFFTLGLKRYGYKIDKENLYIIGILSKKISINSIYSISYELRSTGQSMTYFYIITDKNNKEYNLSYSTLDRFIYQELIKDLIKINPNIRLTDEIKKLLESEITKKILRFDFNIHKGEFFKRDRELSQKHPSLDAFIGLTIGFIILPIPIIFGAVGNNLLIDIYGSNYESYRIWAVIISGIAVTTAITNLFISLVSMYLGHKLTFISLTISLLGLYFGFKA